MRATNTRGNTHINHLRAKIEANRAQPFHILCVFEGSYKFSDPDKLLKVYAYV
jgi:hypothetical protein